MKPRQTKEARKIAKFRRIMERALYFAEVNDSTWSDMVGAINTIQRVAILKAMDTLQSVKALEKQTKSGPDMTKMTSDTVADKIKLANQLIAQGTMWDKIEKKHFTMQNSSALPRTLRYANTGSSRGRSCSVTSRLSPTSEDAIAPSPVART